MQQAIASVCKSGHRTRIFSLVEVSPETYSTGSVPGTLRQCPGTFSSDLEPSGRRSVDKQYAIPYLRSLLSIHPSILICRIQITLKVLADDHVDPGDPSIFLHPD